MKGDEVIQAVVEYLAGQDDVVAAYLFGSHAADRARPSSDVDIAVVLRRADKQMRFERRLQLMTALSDTCGCDADVIVLDDASPILQHQVLKHGQRIYERDRQARVEFEVRAGKVYADLKPMYDLHTDELLQTIKEVGLSGRRRHHRRSTETPR